MSVKSSVVGFLSKFCSQCALELLRWNFEDSRDQVAFRMALLKNYLNTDGRRSYPNVLSYRWF